MRKWRAKIYIGKKYISVGHFDDDYKAAMTINWMCRQYGIPPKNPGVPAQNCTHQVVRSVPRVNLFFKEIFCILYPKQGRNLFKISCLFQRNFIAKIFFFFYI